MILKRPKSLFLFPILLLVLLFSACSMFSGRNGEGSISFKLDKDIVQKIRADQKSVSYPGSRAAGDDTLFADISVLGDYQETIPTTVDEEAEVTFKSIPIGAQVYVQAIVYKKTGDTREELYKGQSKSFTVKRGQNRVVFALKAVGGNSNLPANVLPESLIFVANALNGGADTNDGTEEHPLDSIENAVFKIHELVSTGKAYEGQEWGIVLLSDLSGAQVIPNDADDDIYRLYLASKDAADIKTINGGFTQAPDDIDDYDTGSTLTILSMKDIIIQCVKITGGWANAGGGIRHIGKALYIMPGVEIFGNKARLYGAGIYTARFDPAFFNVSISLSIYGGVIGGEAGKENICTGSENGGPGSGGGVYLCGSKEGYGWADVYFTIEDGLIKGNKAHMGCGVFIEGSSFVEINGGAITENAAFMDKGYESGGGIYLVGENNYDSKFTMNGGSITSNKAVTGAGIYAVKNPLAIYGGTISGNKAIGGEGAGIYFDQSIKSSNYVNFYMHGNPVFGANDYIRLTHSYISPYTIRPIVVDGALTGTAPVATIQLDKYNESDIVLKDGCTPQLSSSAFAAVCSKFNVAAQTKNESGDELPYPVSWSIDDTGALYKNVLELYVEGQSATSTRPDSFSSIDEAVAYLQSLESSGTDLSGKDITIYVDGILGSARQTISGTLNAHSLIISSANGTDNETGNPKDSIQDYGLNVTLEGTTVVLDCIKISRCNNSSALEVGDNSNKQTRVVLGTKAFITNNYPGSGDVAPVYIHSGASVTMKDGGKITANFYMGSSPYGAYADAVFIDNGASFDMQGGTITENVYTKAMPGIIPSGIAVCVSPTASFSIGGNAVLFDPNTQYGNNIYLSAGVKIKVTKDLTASKQCKIIYDDINASLGDVILEPAAGVNIANASKLFGLELAVHPWYLGFDGKLTAVNPKTYNMYIAVNGTGDGSSAASPLGSIDDAVAAMNDEDATYILNIIGRLPGAQVIQGDVIAKKIFIKGTDSTAAFTGGSAVDYTLVIALDNSSSAQVIISDLEISGAQMTGLIVANQKSMFGGPRDVVLEDGVRIINNGNGTDDYNGGGIYVGNMNSILIAGDCIVQNNKAGSNGEGAGVYLEGAEIELKDDVSFAADNEIYISDYGSALYIGGPLSQNPVATITPYDHYYLLNEQIMYLGYVYEDNGYSQQITTTTLADECSKFTVTSDDGINHWYINSDGELKIE